MAANIDEIVSNCFYNAETLNINDFYESNGSDDLIETKQIYAEIQALLDNMNDAGLDKKLYLKKMYELGTRFLTILTKSSLVSLCHKLKSVKQPGHRCKGQSVETFSILDLVIDIEEFYATFIPLTKKNLKCLHISNLANPDYNLECAVNYFWDEAKYIIDLMDDIEERSAVIFNSNDTTKPRMLMYRTRPQKQAQLIARAAVNILHKFEQRCADEEENFAMSRLYRRMTMLLKDRTFTKFSERDEERYEIFERLSKYEEVIHREGQGFYNYADIVRQLEGLKRDIAEQCNKFLLELPLDINYFRFLVMSSTIDNVSYIRSITKVFQDIYNAFESYVKRFEIIRKSMDEAWNTDFQLNASI